VSVRVLIAEDSPTQAAVLHELLIEHGYQVTVTASGEEALEEVERAHFDIVVSDVVMPGMNGYELCHHIKERLGDSAPLVLLLTSLGDPSDVIRGLEVGADNYLRKPYEGEILVSRVRSMLDRRSIRPATADGTVGVNFLGEWFDVRADKHQILSVLLSSFEDLVRSNKSLEEMARKAEAATRARDEVVATVSHDLRNPLATIYTSAAMMLEMDLPENVRTQQIGVIHRTADRMMKLLQDLLDVSKIEEGRFNVAPAPESVRSILSEAVEAVQGMAAQQNIEVTSSVTDAADIVMIDRGRWLQALLNLIGNALRFTPAGGRIELRAYRQGDEFVFSVRDTGKGIAPEDLPRVFDRYFQAARNAREGAGLGLAIVQGIVNAHGGSVSVDSTLGEGTTFYLTVPIAAVRATG
jgi:two-component system sensor histidine kinase/response regulator